MDSRELMQVSIQLPVSELGRLSALMEQVQQMLSGGERSAAAAMDSGQSSSFDPNRFQELTQAAGAGWEIAAQEVEAASITAALSKLSEPSAAEIPPLSESGDPVSASGERHWQDMEAASHRAVVEQALTTPLSAGVTIENAGDLTPAQPWKAEEKLVAAGPAPLTAQAVSLAFQRDDRRYDNGFPLY